MRDLFIARQPIFDKHHHIAGYELLYRGSAGAERAGDDLNAAGKAWSVIVDALLGLGLTRLTEGETAFINVSESVLLDGVGDVLDPHDVVVELLETVRPTPEVVAACRDLKSRGFRIALDDYTHGSQPGPLLELADVVKVDVLESSDRIDTIVAELAPLGIRLLAEKVESAEMHARCAALGVDLFQGFHYFRPETLMGRDLDATSVAIMRLLSMLSDLGVTDRAVEEAFRADPALSYKLLRIVNSAALGGRGVDSIGHAMRLVGRDPLHRWLSLLLLTLGRGGGHVRLELIRSALLRGRMCEVLGNTARTAVNRDLPAGGTLFLVGLLSHLDVLLGREMAGILEDINVSPDARAALLNRAGKAGALLDGVVRYSEADWSGAAERFAVAGVPEDALGDVYLDALGWAGLHMRLHEHAA
jgi:EAL and modified HD-GYP domain-containing signal transduction protein